MTGRILGFRLAPLPRCDLSRTNRAEFKWIQPSLLPLNAVVQACKPSANTPTVKQFKEPAEESCWAVSAAEDEQLSAG